MIPTHHSIARRSLTNLRKIIPHNHTKSRFDRTRLPSPLAFYQHELSKIKVRGKWAQALCCFHEERHPSLSVNIMTGAYCCFSCGAHGGDILAFHMVRYGQSFKEAAQKLGAWRV